jgi:hypothetical protein
MCVFAAGAFLFRTKHEVLALEKALRDTTYGLSQTREKIIVLKSEWSYLTNPKRIQQLVRRYLPQFQPLTQHQLMPLAFRRTP